MTSTWREPQRYIFYPVRPGERALLRGIVKKATGIKEKVKFRNSSLISIKCNCNPYRKGRQANSYVDPGYRVRGLQIKFRIFPYIRQAKGTLINANEIVPVGFLLSIIFLALPLEN